MEWRILDSLMHFALAWTALTDIQARVFHTAYIVFGIGRYICETQLP
jgi:hypothetical protein